MIEFFNTYISPSALKRALSVLKSGWISEGKLVKEFEEALSSQLGLKNPVSLNSCTSALHLALALTGIGPGDEVILPAQTFVATGLSILMQRATPIFADIQLYTGNIDPESIKNRITDRTKAIIPVHWGGYPCDMDEIYAVSRDLNLTVIEDAAHALGAIYKERPIGTLSRFTAFSFQAIKHLTTGDGGALCCLDEDDYKRAMAKRWFGIDRENSAPTILGEREYNIQELGYKYHMNDINASIGLGNLEYFDHNLNRRIKIAEFYRKELNRVPGLTLLKYSEDRISAYWLFTMLVEKRLDFIRMLKDLGIPSSVVHQRIDKNHVFGGLKPDLYNQRIFNDLQISIPVHSSLTDDDTGKIVKAIKKGW